MIGKYKKITVKKIRYLYQEKEKVYMKWRLLTKQLAELIEKGIKKPSILEKINQELDVESIKIHDFWVRLCKQYGICYPWKLDMLVGVSRNLDENEEITYLVERD
jgi:hypothetical protein